MGEWRKGKNFLQPCRYEKGRFCVESYVNCKNCDIYHLKMLKLAILGIDGDCNIT